MTSWQALVFSGWAANSLENDTMASDLPGMSGVDGTAFEAFSMRELTSATFDEGLLAAGNGLAVVFFWGVDCFNCEVAKKTMVAQREAIEALDLCWFHANVYADMALGKRFALHGVPTLFFFHHGKKLGRAGPAPVPAGGGRRPRENRGGGGQNRTARRVLKSTARHPYVVQINELNGPQA
jgi:hypothetical protein